MGTADANYSPGSLSFTRPSVITREALRITSVFNGIIASLPTLLHALHSFFAPSFLLLSFDRELKYLLRITWTGRESNVFLAKGEKPGTANPRREGRMRTTAAAT